MNLARWFMLINGLAWFYFWTRVWQLMMPWDPQGKGHTHGRAYIWMLIGHHALEWGSESRLMIGIVLAQLPVLLPLRLLFNWQGLYGDFFGINADAWVVILTTVLSFGQWYYIGRVVTNLVQRRRDRLSTAS